MIAVAVLAATASNPAYASDAKSRFAVKGAGALPCRDFNAAIVARNSRAAAAAGWFAGYISAANRYEPDTYELLPWQDPLYLTASISAYCEANPSARLYQAADKLVKSLRADRLKTATPMKALVTDGTRIRIYAATVARMKRALQRRDMLTGPVNSNTDAALVTGIRKFQKAQKLEVTGIPDQETLFRLLGAGK
ncbi:MAG: peptidoglycan-binding domain-containing protein [Pacificimonas sp.]